MTDDLFVRAITFGAEADTWNTAQLIEPPTHIEASVLLTLGGDFVTAIGTVVANKMAELIKTFVGSLTTRGSVPYPK
jgi:hypothetical protein